MLAPDPAGPLMSTEEYLSVLVSIVIGLGISHLLTGVGNLLVLKRALPLPPGATIVAKVKQTVADKISLRAVYPLADIRDLRYEDDGRLILEWRNGKETTLLGDNVRVDNDRDSNKFRRQDAERLIAAGRRQSEKEDDGESKKSCCDKRGGAIIAGVVIRAHKVERRVKQTSFLQPEVDRIRTSLCS